MGLGGRSGHAGDVALRARAARWVGLHLARVRIALQSSWRGDKWSGGRASNADRNTQLRTAGKQPNNQRKMAWMQHGSAL